MKPYADIPARRGAQMAGDLLVGAWCLAWAWVGTVVHRATMRLAAPGHRLEEAGRDFRGRMDGAGSQVDDLPILDDRVAGPFREAAGAGTSIETAGHDLVVAVASGTADLHEIGTLAQVLQLLKLPDGTRFMAAHDDRMELAPRDIVARAIDAEIKRYGLDYVHLDISAMGADFVKQHFPTIHARLLDLDLDMTKEPIPVVPAQHYTCGGVVIDRDGNLVHMSEQAGQYLRMGGGEPSRNLLGTGIDARINGTIGSIEVLERA